MTALFTVPEEAAPKPVFHSLRPPVLAPKRGVVVAGTSLGAAAGARILREGGSATDAAIAAACVQAVVMPYMGGPGGDMFFIHLSAQGSVSTLTAAGQAPAAASLELYETLGTKMPEQGVFSISVPGLVGGWFEALRRFGRLPPDRIFAQAIEFAEEGFPLHKNFVRYLHTNHFRSQTAIDEGLKRVFFLGLASPPNFCAVLRQPQLARTLQTLAKEGPDAFYRGDVGRSLVRSLKSRGGILDAADLEHFQAEWKDPIFANVWNWDIYQVPPPSQGIAMLETLRITERIRLEDQAHNSAEYLHQFVAAIKLALDDRDAFIADPRFHPVTTDVLFGDEHISKAVKCIRDADRSEYTAAPDTGSTTTIVAVDKFGNGSALVQSLGDEFGSGVYVDELGFALHNRMKGFTLLKGHPNCVGPGKRPLHTLCPSLAKGPDGSRLIVATPGGGTQPQTLAQIFVNFCRYDFDLQEAVEAPRIARLGNRVLLEGRFDEEIVDRLREMGHLTAELPAWSSVVGGCAAIQMMANGINVAAADPRRDSYAIPE